LPRAHREPHVDFPLPSEPARELQVGNVRASDEHEQDSRGHQQQKAVRGDSHGPVSQEVQSKDTVAVRLGKIMSQGLADRRQILSCLGQ